MDGVTTTLRALGPVLAVNRAPVERDEMLTIADLAGELHCSKAHVAKVIRGEVAGVSPLPAICLGRRRLVRRSTFEQWVATNEKAAFGDMLAAESKVRAA